MREMVSSAEMLRFIAAGQTDRDLAADKLSKCGLSPVIMDCGQLRHLTDEGYLTAFIVQKAGWSLYCVWVSKTLDGGLHVNAAVSLKDDADFSDLVYAVETYAREQGCNYCRFTTRRPGLVAKAEANGYKAAALMLVKTF